MVRAARPTPAANRDRGLRRYRCRFPMAYLLRSTRGAEWVERDKRDFVTRFPAPDGTWADRAGGGRNEAKDGPMNVRQAHRGWGIANAQTLEQDVVFRFERFEVRPFAQHDPHLDLDPARDG